MKYRLLLLFIVLSILGGCIGLRESKYVKYNAFEYLPEQPHFHFENDTLKIEGEFGWASLSKANPNPAWLPKKAKQV